MCGCMAGFRRLCGRCCCVGGRMSRRGAEGAKLKRLRGLWGVVPVGRQGGKNRGLRVHAHERSGEEVVVFKRPLNGDGCGVL